MRIAADLSFFAADKRGMGRMVRNLLIELLAAQEDDFVFFVRQAEDIGPVSEWLKTINPASRTEIFLRRDLSGISADICWYPWNRVDPLPLSGFRVVTINDVNPFVFPYQSIWRWWDQRRDEMQFRKAAVAADRIVTISDFSRQEIVRYLGVDGSKIKVMPLGVDATSFADPAASWRTSRDSAGANLIPRLLYVGSDDKRKNLQNLMQAVQILHRTMNCRATLTCCGVGGETGEKYSRLFADAGLDAAVTFAGFVSDDQLRKLYGESDLFVFPSLYEGYGLPILEAMAAGLPVVTSGAASLPEVGGVAAVYCDAGNPAALAGAIRNTWENDSLRCELRNRGLQRVAQFTWGKAAQELRNIFAEK